MAPAELDKINGRLQQQGERIATLEEGMRNIAELIDANSESQSIMHKENRERLTKQDEILSKLALGQQANQTTIKVTAGIIIFAVALLELIAKFVNHG